MADSTDLGATPKSAHAKERRLESWGEIAAYLRREIRTVQRWEKTLGLPIHRLQVGKQSSVYAYPSELDKWYREREPLTLKDDLSDEPTSSTPPVSPPTFPFQSIAVKPNSEIPFYKRKSTWFGGGAFLVIFGMFIAAFLVWTPSISIQPKTSVASDEKLRLFVRPFQTIAEDASQSEFADGLTSELNTRLGRLDPKHLGVIAPTSAKQLGSKPIAELEPLLKLNYVLEGSVLRVNEKVRIDIALIAVRDQTPLWSDSYTENLADILKVQDEVAERVAQKLLLNLPPTAANTSAATVDPEGYSSYLRGRRFLGVRDLSRSVPAFEDAVKKLPQYSPAHAGLAASYTVMGEAPNDTVPPSISAPKARAEVQRALALDPSSAEAHYVLGNILMSYDWDFPAAESQLREAVRLEPNSPTAHQWLAQYLMTQNRPTEAQVETNKALELDPVSQIYSTAGAEAFYFARDFDSTIAQAKLTLEQSANSMAEFFVASAYREKKMYPESLQHFRAACSLTPNNPGLLMALGHALGVSGDRAGALAILAELQTLSSNRYVPAVYYAGIYLGMGDKDRAFTWLDRAVKERDDRLIYLAVEPMADPLRSDPRFQTLLMRVHLNNFTH